MERHAMPRDPLVTIGIPTYNRADTYFPGALKCALDQTYSNIEIIVSDNCSTDSTAAVVESANDPRIRYIRQESNIPAIENFNFLLAQAQGTYFSLFHDDDMLDMDFVETCMRAAQGDAGYGLIRTGLRWIDDTGQTLSTLRNNAQGLPLEDFYLAWFRGRIPMHLPSTLFNTEGLRKIGGLKSRHQLFNDVMAEVKLAAIMPRLDIPDIKASFRHHPVRSTTATSIRFWCEDSLELLETMCGLVDRDAEIIREAGARSLTNHNIRMIRQIDSLPLQIKGYWVVFRNFNLPAKFLVKNILRSIRKSMSKKSQ
jgi:glycosyltransferase involved in cell wall biosynthesis